MSTRERQGEFLREIFEILRSHSEGLMARDVLAALESRCPPSQEEREEYPNRPGVRRYEKSVRFATISATKAGWPLKNRGVWTVMDEGLIALDRHSDPADFARAAVLEYRKWRAARGDDEDVVPEVDEQTSFAAVTLKEAEEASWEEIAGYLAEIDPYKLQDLVKHLLEAMGYYVVWTAPPGPDKGVDLVVHNDPLGTTSPASRSR